MRKNNAYEKRVISDGYYFHLSTTVAYIKTIEPLIRKSPVFFTSRFPILLSAHRGWDRKKKSLQRIGSWISANIFSSSSIQVKLPQCDVLLFYSTPKPNWYPAIPILGARLEKKGFRVALMTRDSIRLMPGDTIQLPGYGLGRKSSIRILFRSFFYTLVLYMHAVKNAMHVLPTLNNPFQVLYEILQAGERLRFADYILSQVKPRVIATNGDHIPVASELLMSRYSKEAHKIWFFNELPTPDMLPIVSDEVWVWNNLTSDLFKKLIPKHKQPIFTVTGRAEIDVSSQGPVTPGAEEKELLKKTKSKNVFLFLSEYIEGHIYSTYDMTQEALRWLAEVASRLPDWYFIYKSRPFHHKEELPGADLVEGIANVIIPQSSIELKHFFHWPNLRAVAACGSTGLFTAAGIGIPSLRFILSPASSAQPVLDEVCTLVRSPAELLAVLQKIGTHGFKRKIKNPEAFPYRGEVIDRMEKATLARL